MASRSARPTASSDSSSVSCRCSSWRRGTINISYGEPLQYGQMMATSSLAATTRSPVAISASTRGAQQAVAGEAGEGALLVEHLAGHERQAEQLPVGVRQRRAGLAAVVDDRLRVADVRGRGVVDEAALEGHHELAGGLVVEAVERLRVVGGVDEHLVDAGALGGDVHRAVVVDGEALLAVECRVQVGHDPHPPVAALADRLERRRRGFLVAGAERARTPESTSSRRTRGAKSVGRWARSATIVTQRPVS